MTRFLLRRLASSVVVLAGVSVIVFFLARFIPTDVGRIVSAFLTNHFTRYVDYGFTAALEDELDAISRGEEEWHEILDKFWAPFRDLVEDKDKSVRKSDVVPGFRPLMV